MAERSPENQTGRSRPSFGFRVLRSSALVILWSGLILSALVAYYAWDLPDVENYEKHSRRPSVTLLASDSSVISTYGDLYANVVRYNEVPPYLIQAIVSTEDRRFFDHFGIDIFGIARAALANLRAGSVRQGGSTLTQQLAKNLFLTPERSLRRKIQELLLAFWLEAKLSKRQIFTIYLNRVYLGAGTFGVDAAARRYFGKSVRQINLKEAALLVGLLKAPSRYSPFRDKNLSLIRTNQVLSNMVAAGFLSKQDALQAKMDDLKFTNQVKGSGARYFSDWLLQRAFAFVGRTSRDLIIKTTLSSRLQKLGEARVVETLTNAGNKRNVGQAALVSLSPDGAIRAMIGGRHYASSQFNRVNQALRQPGSAFKLFVYLAALEAGIEPHDEVVDGPVSIKGWKPRNYSGKFLGRISLRTAFAKSINTVAVKVSEQIGRQKVIKAAKRLGITSKLKSHPSIALGVGEVTLLDLTSAYAIFSNKGFSAWPYGILEIRNNKNEILYKRSPLSTGPLVKNSIVKDMNSMLVDAVKFGTGKRARLSKKVAGKTGTSQGFRDAWFIGFTSGLVTGVWVGNDNFSPMKKVTGGSIPADLWRKFMMDALKGIPDTSFQTP